MITLEMRFSKSWQKQLSRLLFVILISSVFIATCGVTQEPAYEPATLIPSSDPEGIATDLQSFDPLMTPQVSSNFTYLSPDEFSINFQWEVLDVTSLEEVLVLLPFEGYLVDDQRITLDIVSWEGMRERLVTIEYPGDAEFDDFNFFVSVLPNTSNHLLVSPLDFVYLSEIYILSLDEEEVFGIDPGCESSLSYARDIALGSNYLVFRCNESRHIFNIISLGEHPSTHVVSIEGLVDEPLNYEPKWIGSGTLVLEDVFRRGLCVIQSLEWEVFCWTSSDWIGNVSPDGEFYETRLGRFDGRPNELGVESLDCRLEDLNCESLLRAGWIPTEGDYILEDAAWLENSQGLLYVVHIHSDETTMEPDETEFWLLDIETMSVERIGFYDRMLSFSTIKPSPFPIFWSPDGEWVVVTDAKDHFLLSI
jgi:hypothetical protein